MVASMTMTVVGGIIIYYHEPSRQMLIVMASKIKPKFFKSFDKNLDSKEERGTSDKLNLDTSNRWRVIKPELIVIGITLLLVKLNNQGEITVSTDLDRDLTFAPTFWKGCWEFYRNYQPFVGGLTTLLGVSLSLIFPISATVLQVIGWQIVSHSRS